MTRAASVFLWSLLAAVAVPNPVSADTIAECYDLKVIARVVEQIPSDVPDCSDCIIMRWPWFLDFKIKKVVEGNWAGKALTALAVQHTYLRSRYGVWFLRKNDVGGFNIAQYDTPPVRCAAGITPARAYLRPGPDQTLTELRDAGEKRYGKAPR